MGAEVGAEAKSVTRREREREKQEFPVGIASDKYVVHLVGHDSYYVVNRANGALMGGPWRDRAVAQARADQLNVTFRERT